MNPTDAIRVFSNLIWPVGIVIAPLLFWFAGRRAIAQTQSQPQLHADIRRAATVLGFIVASASALATLVQLSYPDVAPICLFQTSPFEPPALYLVTISGAFVFGLLIWVVVGSGARQLGVFGGALGKREPYQEGFVRRAVVLYALLSPIFLYMGFAVSPNSSLCLTGRGDR
jgi:hypothetical protein